MTTERKQNRPISADVIADTAVMADRMGLELRTINRLIEQGMPSVAVDGLILVKAGDVFLWLKKGLGNVGAVTDARSENHHSDWHAVSGDTER
jgi:hypothetical protein